MRVVFMGTPDFSVPPLEALIKNHTVEAVVTQQDKPRGRGRNLLPTPVKECALKHDITVYQPDKVKDEEFVKVLKDINPDVIVVIAFGQILSEEILNIPKYGCINVHASLLPKYRGAAPIQWAVINGDEKSGVCTMYMEKGLDTGDIIDVAEYTLDAKETGGSLFDKLSLMGADLILTTLEKLANGTATRTKQDDSKSSYAAKITKDMGALDFNRPAKELECLIRGVNPWPVAYTMLDGKRVKIYDADVVDGCAEAGTIISKKKELIIATGDKALSIKEIQPEGKRRMAIKDFLNGKPIEADRVEM